MVPPSETTHHMDFVPKYDSSQRKHTNCGCCSVQESLCGGYVAPITANSVLARLYWP